MDDGCAALIGILLAIGIAIVLVIYVIIPLSLFLVVGIAGVGTISGAAVAVKNFGEVLIEAHKTIK